MYECLNCGHQIDVESIQAMPTCPNCNGPRVWTFRSDRHSEDEYPVEQLRIRSAPGDVCRTGRS